MQNKNRIVSLLRKIEDGFAGILLFTLITLLLFQILARLLPVFSIPASAEYVTHITLWIAFTGAMIATRDSKHLSMSLGANIVSEKMKAVMQSVVDFICVMVCTILLVSSIVFLALGFDPDNSVGTIGIFPVRIAISIMPLSFAVIITRFIVKTAGNLVNKLIAAAGILPGIALSLKSIVFLLGGFSVFDDADSVITAFSAFYDSFLAVGFWPLLIALLGSSIFFGTPIFIMIGGLTILLFLSSELLISDIPQAAYAVLIRNEIPAIPLFTLAGFIISESKAGERFVKLFRALIGWIPGGIAIVAIVVCAFFTTFTGAAGVTILALGGLLSFVLIKEKYKDSFAYGLITSSGSIGLLFPPSLPVIIYGVAATLSIKDLYVGGILPGLLLVITLGITGIIHSKKNNVERVEFSFEEIKEPAKLSFWELMLPFIVFFCFFSGIATLVEIGAITIAYIIILEVFIYRDIKLSSLPKIFAKCMPISGGIFVVLAMAKGFASFIIYQQIPELLSAWCETYISSPIVFLLLLNIALLVIGCFLDIFSAILVFAPLIIPLGVLYNVHPIHLGIIFLAHLQVANITPPVGVNLFLAAYSFNMPLTKVYRNVVPFYILLVIAIFVITYVPFLTTAFLPK